MTKTKETPPAIDGGNGKKENTRIPTGYIFDALIDDPEMLVDEMLPCGELAFIIAPKSTYKSYIALELAVRVATGTKFLGHDTPKGKVVFIEKEDKIDATVRRARNIFGHIIENEKVPESSLRSMIDANFHLMGRGFSFSVESLYRAIEEYAPKLLVISSFTHLLIDNMIEEGDNIAAARVLSYLSFSAERNNVTILFVHHVSKTAAINGIIGYGASRGASSIENIARQVIYLQRHPAGKNVISVNLDTCNYRHLLAENFHIEFHGGTFRKTFDPDDVKKETGERKQAEPETKRRPIRFMRGRNEKQ
jgi:RecA-family ATPase